jgi:hypothetical protein
MAVFLFKGCLLLDTRDRHFETANTRRLTRTHYTLLHKSCKFATFNQKNTQLLASAAQQTLNTMDSATTRSGLQEEFAFDFILLTLLTNFAARRACFQLFLTFV